MTTEQVLSNIHLMLIIGGRNATEREWEDSIVVFGPAEQHAVLAEARALPQRCEH